MSVRRKVVAGLAAVGVALPAGGGSGYAAYEAGNIFPSSVELVQVRVGHTAVFRTVDKIYQDETRNILDSLIVGIAVGLAQEYSCTLGSVESHSRIPLATRQLFTSQPPLIRL